MGGQRPRGGGVERGQGPMEGGPLCPLFVVRRSVAAGTAPRSPWKFASALEARPRAYRRLQRNLCSPIFCVFCGQSCRASSLGRPAGAWTGAHGGRRGRRVSRGGQGPRGRFRGRGPSNLSSARPPFRAFRVFRGFHSGLGHSPGNERDRGFRKGGAKKRVPGRDALGEGRGSAEAYFAARLLRRSSSWLAEPSRWLREAMNFAYSVMKILPGGRKSKSEGLSRKNSR